ncbi:MAG: hypothetical protein NT028_10650 [candidate division Zixibacteria bacterium]|nr:hypothetical protein [candidate division Zixibacteria bacterium]
MHLGLVGGIIGSVIGVAGGVLGTYFSIRNTNGPLERAFMVKCVVLAWIAVAVFLGLLLILPAAYRIYLWIPYGVLLVWSMIKLNRKQAEIRQQEKMQQFPESS